MLGTRCAKLVGRHAERRGGTINVELLTLEQILGDQEDPRELLTLERILGDQEGPRVATRVDVVNGPGTRPRAMSVAQEHIATTKTSSGSPGAR